MAGRCWIQVDREAGHEGVGHDGADPEVVALLVAVEMQYVDLSCRVYHHLEAVFLIDSWVVVLWGALLTMIDVWKVDWVVEPLLLAECLAWELVQVMTSTSMISLVDNLLEKHTNEWSGMRIEWKFETRDERIIIVESNNLPGGLDGSGLDDAILFREWDQEK